MKIQSTNARTTRKKTRSIASILMILSICILCVPMQSASVQETGAPGSPAWGSYTRLSYTLTETRWAMVAANGKYDPDYVIVVFTDNLTGQFDLYFTKSTDGGVTWTTPEIAVNPDFNIMETELSNAAIVMDDNGIVHVSFARQKTWWPRDTSPTGIYYARYNGVSWSAPIVIYENMSPGYLAVAPNDITIGSDNMIHLAYGSDYPGNDNGDIWYCRSEDCGFTWTSPVNVNTFDDMDVGYPPSLAADDLGYVYWANGDDWYNSSYWSELYFRRSPNNGTAWDTQMAISRRENGDRFPRLMCDNTGGVYVVWIGAPPNSLFFKRSTDHGSNWDPYYGGIALTDTVPGIGDCYFAELDDYGLIHIVYLSTATGTPEAYYMKIDKSGNIVIPSQIITPDDGYPSYPTYLTVANDHVYVVTRDQKDGNWEAYFLTIDTDWPMFHHDPAHKGHSASEAPDTNNTIWYYATGDWIWSSSPAVADGKVYVGSWDNKTYCLNATTGEQIWNYTTGWFVSSSPAVADGKVYVGSYDNKTYCLNATTGEQIWNYTTGDIVVSSPTAAVDKVYVASMDNKTYCLNATTGEQIWNYTTGDWISSSPAVALGKVYIGSGDSKVYCLNATTGEQIWNYTTGDFVESSPTVSGDVLFIGSDDDKVYALNATTGEQIWNYTTEDWVVSSPAVADGKVYVGSEDNKVYCLNATTGEHIWNYSTGLMVRSSPAIADGKVYVGSFDRNLYCLNASSGTLIWSYTTGGRIVSSPAICDGKVFVGSEDTKVYAFEDPKYTLSITASYGGTTNPVPGTYTYYQGTTIRISGISITGYELNHWELDDSWNYSNPIVVTMNANYTLHAVFTYVATIEAHCSTEVVDVNVSISMDGLPTGYVTPHAFNLTGTHNFTIPNIDLNGHPFKQWSSGETDTTIAVTLGETYTAYYQARYNLTITATEGGTTDPSPGDYNYWDGAIVNIAATPTLGYLLDHWELDGSNAGAANPIQVTMNENHTLRAGFSWVGICNITITTTTGGTTDPSPGTYCCTNGTMVSVSAATSSLGYVFDHWKLDNINAGTSTPISVTMNTNHTLQAVFTWVGIYNLTITTTTGGTTSPSPGTYSYTNGTSLYVTSIPYTHMGYEFDRWLLDGGDMGPINPILVTMNSNHTLRAIFYQPPGGCPFLYVYDGVGYVNEGLLDIHKVIALDTETDHILKTPPKGVNGTYEFQLVEQSWTFSRIDRVALYAALQDGTTIELPLISALHSDQSNVLRQLLCDDDLRTNLLGAVWSNGASESIQLRFQALPPNVNVKAFTFHIEGYSSCQQLGMPRIRTGIRSP